MNSVLIVVLDAYSSLAEYEELLLWIKSAGR